MKQLLPITLLLGLAVSLPAQKLSFGEITLVTPGTSTTPPTYLVNVVLTGAAASSVGTVAGLQFDMNYDPTQLGVTMGLGASSTAASMSLNQTPLPAQYNPSTIAAANPGPGVRAIIIGCCTGTQTTPNSNLFSDGVVATLTVTPTSSATSTGQTLTLVPTSLAGTSQGGLNQAAMPIGLTIGAGPNDPGATGVVNLYTLYLVGGNYPYTTGDFSPNFGSGKLTLNDLILELLYQTGAQGYTEPATCTDRFDALDTFPLDTQTTRGGDGVVNLNDLILELLRQTGAQGYTALPMRTPRGQTCTETKTAQTRLPLEVHASLELGPVQGAGTSQETVPVYLRAGRDLARAGLAFSASSGQAQLHFQAAPGMSPSIVYDSQPGLVALAFLNGLDAHGGDNILLGYIVGPAGSAASLKINGTSAAGLNDQREFGVNFPGGTLR